MKFNGTIFSKPQQDQLKENIGNELEKVSAKVDEVDARMLNYKGDWISGDEYHEKDIVTWSYDGHLYEVIKAHTSSASIKPDNTEYYKAMTATKYYSKTYQISTQKEDIVNDVKTAINANRRAFCYTNRISGYAIRLDFSVDKTSSFPGVIATGFHRDEENDFWPAIIQYFLTTQIAQITKTILSETAISRTNLTTGSSITIYYEA